MQKLHNMTSKSTFKEGINMDKITNEIDGKLDTNVVPMTEPIVNEIRRLLTKQELKGYLSEEEKKKYFHCINMLGEIYNEEYRRQRYQDLDTQQGV